MKINVILMCLAVGWALGVGCGTEQYCSDSSECLATEFCNEDNRCENNPCFNRVEGDFIRCAGDDAVVCDASHLPMMNPCGQFGCVVEAEGCAECVPGSGESCDGDDLVTCDDRGLIEMEEFCPTGCEDLTAGSATCASCEPNVTACFGDYLVACDAAGAADSTHCEHGCTQDATAMCNACTPSTLSCDAEDLVTCGVDGQVQSTETCEHGCAPDRLACNDCPPDTTGCLNEQRVTCDVDGLVVDAIDCFMGCNELSDRCHYFEPTALAWTDVTAGISSLVVTAQQYATIESTTGDIVIDGQPLTGYVSHQTLTSGIQILSFDHIDIQGYVEVTGVNTLALVSTTTITIGGYLDAAARMDSPGPGGWPTGMSNPGNGDDASCDEWGYSGGGGGGHAGNGGEGSAGGGYSVGVAGLPVNDWLLDPPEGGGAGGGCDWWGHGAGGASGGILLLAAGQSVEVQAGSTVDTSGGGGQGGAGGGGAGGLISIEAPEVTVAGRLLSIGGGGGCEVGDGHDGSEGSYGCYDGTQASGDGGPSATSVDGGDGQLTPTSAGYSGGGSAGFLIINVGPTQGTPVVTGTLIPDSVFTDAVKIGMLALQ